MCGYGLRVYDDCCHYADYSSGQMESGMLCVFALLPCSGPHNPHPSHRSGIKDGFHELGMEHMSLIPPKQMFCLSLVCQSYDLQADGFCSPSRWFMGKAADIIFH